MVFRIFLILHQTCERVRVPEFSLSEFLLSREQVAQVAGVAGFLKRVGRIAGRGEWRKAIQPGEN